MAHTKTHMAVLDTETLAKFDDAVILSLGMVVVPYDNFGTEFLDILKAPGLELKFDVRDQIKTYGRKTEASTIAWWKKQDAEAKKVLTPCDADVPLEYLPTALDAFIKSTGLDWKQIDLYDRNSFDIKKLQHIYEMNLGKKTPWDYQACWEIATTLKFLGFDRYGGVRPADVPGMIYHNALHDAALDAYRILKALRAVGVIE